MLPTRNTVRQIADAVSLQWANGKNEGRMTPGVGRFQPIVGWYSEVGKDAVFDGWMAALSTPQLEIRHPRSGGPAEVKLHWSFGEQLRIFPITSGPVAPTVAASLAARSHMATVEAGIGIRWGRGVGERSKLAIRGYLEIAGEVFPRPVQISVRSRMTDELLAALIDHVRVCELADAMVDRAKHPGVVSPYELALPLGAGPEASWGKGETTTVVPLASHHPPAVDLPYLREIFRSVEMAEWVVRDWPDVLAWAQEFSFAAESEAASYEGGGIGR